MRFVNVSYASLTEVNPKNLEEVVMKTQMVDVLDYTRRLFAAVFLCPVAAAFWVLFAASGFSLTSFFTMCAGFGQAHFVDGT